MNKDNLILVDCISKANSSSFSKFYIPEDEYVQSKHVLILGCVNWRYHFYMVTDITYRYIVHLLLKTNDFRSCRGCYIQA